MAVDPRMIRLLMDLRQAGVDDARILGALERVPREMFVPGEHRHLAYENRALPLGDGQTVSQPEVVARMTEALELFDRAKVLEIGTGSGFQTAVLARLAGQVHTIERIGWLLADARDRLTALGIDNAHYRHGDGSLGWPDRAPFDSILVTAAARRMPPALCDQLAVGGVLVAPIGPPNEGQDLVKVERSGAAFKETSIGLVRFVPLLGGVVGRPRSG